MSSQSGTTAPPSNPLSEHLFHALLLFRGGQDGTVALPAGLCNELSGALTEVVTRFFAKEKS
jgi:hypothetical protein